MSASWKANLARGASEPKLVVGLGEALFDHIGDHFILGGAPLNFAIHAHGMLSRVGGQATVASRVGCDALGDRVHELLDDAGLKTTYLQRDSEDPTGIVEVQLVDGSPTYAIHEHVAWDRMDFTSAWKQLAIQCDAVAFGSLAQRSPQSTQAIRSFLQSTRPECLRVFDVNLRQDYYDAALLDFSLRFANVAKLNEEELSIIAIAFGWSGNTTSEWLTKLRDEFGLHAIALTRGARGTAILREGEQVHGCVTIDDRTTNADSVGAGDASCAGLVVGLLCGWSLQDTLQLANAAGAFVASRRGATPTLPTSLLDWIQATQVKYSDPSSPI